MYYVSPSFHSHFFFIRIKQIIYLFSVFFQASPQQPQYAVPPFYGSQLQGAQEIHSSSVRPHSDLPGSQLQENNHSSSSSTSPKKRKIVGQTLKKRSWWSCLEKIKISCDTKPSAPLNGCRLLASFTRGARNKTSTATKRHNSARTN